MMETVLMVYASMINQNTENNLKARNKSHLMRSGILDCRGKPLLKELEQITLSDIKIDHLKNFFLHFLTNFIWTKSRLQNCWQWMQLFNLNLVGLQAQIWEGRRTNSRDQQLSAELKEFVKTDNVDEVHFVQTTIGVPVLFAVKLKRICNHDKFGGTYEFFIIDWGVDLLVEPK